MRMHLIPLILLLCSIAITDGWLYYRWRKKVQNIWLRVLYWLPTSVFIGFLAYITLEAENFASYKTAAQVIWGFWLLFVIYAPKMLYAIFDSISILFHNLFNVRPKIISRIGSFLAIITLIMLVSGAICGRNRVHVKQITINVPSLPEALNNFTIAHFSDAHLGNWNDHKQTIEKAIALINEQKPDIIVFSGDMVNNFSEELVGYDTIFNRLHATYGKYAVLGNHDYGDYTQWESHKARERNLQQTIQGIRGLGFDLLLNEHRTLTVNGRKLDIVGVENWGVPPFKQYGDLDAALQGTSDSVPKILISHDSSHWRAEVIGKESSFLTLSGHTHAAQIGIITKNIHWSPSKWLYPEWEGLYQEGKQFLYVNRGLGYVGVPMRIGVPPEITLIRLGLQK